MPCTCYFPKMANNSKNQGYRLTEFQTHINLSTKLIMSFNLREFCQIFGVQYSWSFSSRTHSVCYRVIFKHYAGREKLLLLTIQLGNSLRHCLYQVSLACRYKEQDDAQEAWPSTLLLNLHWVRGARKEYILSKKRPAVTYTWKSERERTFSHSCCNWCWGEGLSKAE